VPIVTPISPAVFVPLLVLGSALLAAWTMVRFERRGPRSIAGAFLAKIAAFALLLALPSLVDQASGMPDAKLVIALLIGLPILTYFFLAAAWFARVIVSLFTP
jgi:hypothetical protein